MMSRRQTQSVSATPSDQSVVSRNDFLQSSFDPQKYVQQKFLSQRVEQVKDLHTALISEKNAVADEMKTSVYRHYPNFINASKEISNLESNMQEMRNLLTDFNSQIKSLQNHQVALRPSEDSQTKIRNLGASIDKSKISANTVKDIQWLLELPSRLDMAIALRHYETAVILIESVTQHTRDMSELFVNNETKLQVDRRVQQLVNILLTDLQNIYTKSSDSRKIIGYLMRLGLPDKARETFLDTKSKKLEAEIKKLKLEGDLTLYISDLAQLVFSSVNSTCEEYRTAFISSTAENSKENSELSSGFIVWAVQELEKFGSIFRNQVFNNAPDDFTAIGKCLEIAMLYCDLLEQKGLSLSFVLSQMFYPNLIDSIQNYYLKIQAILTKILSTEDWKASALNEDEWDFRQSANATTVVNTSQEAPETKRQIRNLYVIAGQKEKGAKPSKPVSQNAPTVMMTESAKCLYTYSIQFVNNVCKVITLELVPCVGFVLSTLLEDYMTQLSNVVKTSDSLTDQQCLNIIVNSKYITEELVPKISAQIQKELNRELKDFDKLCRNTQIFHSKLTEAFCAKRSASLFEKVLEWNKVDYSQPIVNENTTPNSRIVKLFVALYTLKGTITSSQSSKAAAPLLASIMDDIVNRMTSAQFWEKRKIDEGGLQQLVLDCRFFVECAADYATESSLKKLQAHMNECVKAVAKEAAMDDPKEALKPEEWFTSKIKQYMSKNAKEMGIRILS